MRFDYTGYNEEKLQELSTKQTIPYILQEVYSFGSIIRDYGYFYPTLFPLNIYHKHGACCVESKPYPHELNSHAYCMFVNNHKDIDMYQKAGMYSEVMFHPFVYYRRTRHIEKAKDAQGTIIFPSHTTPDVDDLSEASRYIDEIEKLPNIYRPLCVCMSWVDIVKGRHKIWIERGFPVYTVGHAYHEDFVERFYELVRHFRYMTSNSIGSQTFYAVEMGIPFFLYGPEPIYFNKSDPGHEKGITDLHKNEEYNKAYNLFNYITTSVSSEQKAYVKAGLGIEDGISRVKMAKILWTAFLKSGRVIKSLKCALSYLLKFLFLTLEDRQRRKFEIFLEIYNKL